MPQDELTFVKLFPELLPSEYTEDYWKWYRVFNTLGQELKLAALEQLKQESEIMSIVAQLAIEGITHECAIC